MKTDQPGDELERALVEIGRQLDAPDGTRISALVRQRIDSPITPRRSTRLRTAVAVALAVVLIATGTMVFSPTARRAVAGWLGLPGIRIRHDPSPLPSPIPSPSATPTVLGLGDLVSLEEAGRRTTFPILKSGLENLSVPDQVYFSTRFPGGQVAFVYEPRSDLPPTKETGVGLLMMQFRGELTGRSTYMKTVPRGTTAEPVTFAGHQGFWIEGPHGFGFTDETGNSGFESFRLAGNTLLWEQNGLTLRIESSLGKQEVLRIAESVN